MSEKRATLAKLLELGLIESELTLYRQRIDALKLDIEKLESALASKSQQVAGELAEQRITSEKLAAHLSAGTILVKFVKIHDFNWDKGRKTNTQRYLAFLLHPDQHIELVDLGDAEQTDGLIHQFLDLLTQSQSAKAQAEAAAALYQRIWAPIENAGGRNARVFVSPDGTLNLLPFAALMEPGGAFLLESIEFSYLTSGRDLAAVKDDKPGMGLFLAANPMFDRIRKNNGSTMPAAAKPHRSLFRSREFALQFEPLPGTAVEAQNVPPLIPGGNQVVLTKADATKSAVLTAKRPKVLHLATHGFFLPDQPEPAIDAQDMDQDDHLALAKDFENPLVRSGLALAGANQALDTKDSEDGLLTALEVSGMDLHGTDLVTLSACETAVGEVKTGEGVYGLRRAFALAGTRNLMMSLWPVSDDITAQQMISFYKLYGSGQAPAQALRAAQLETIDKLRKQTGGKALPSLWAPFIMQTSGDGAK